MSYVLKENILKCCFNVANELGIGFLESIYKNALVIDLKKTGLCVEIEKPFQVRYQGQPAGIFIADLIIENRVIIEVKSCKTLLPEHQAQLINYLKVTDIQDGLLVNFATKKIQIKRLVHPEKFASEAFI